jgi:hypothetical protein
VYEYAPSSRAYKYAPSSVETKSHGAYEYAPSSVETKSHGAYEYAPSSRAYEYAQKNVTWKDALFPRQQPSSSSSPRTAK